MTTEQSAHDLPRLFTPEEVAAEVGNLTASEIRRAIRDGEMGHVPAARGRWLVTREHVSEWIAARAKPATGGPRIKPAPAPLGVTRRSASQARRKH
jgi:excisionase family DNA binding protein